MQDARSAVQKKAVDAAIKGFKKASRGKVIMPCGTGKTRVGMKVMERLKAKVTIVLCPALSLVKQNLECYLQNSRFKFTAMVVCSDESTAKQAREEYGIEVGTTTDPLTINSWVGVDQIAGKRTVIFATYQSSGQLSAAWGQGGMPEIDMIVFDEAHRTAGVEGVFSEALHDKNLKAKHRLFMTATPRTMRASAKRKAAVDGVEIVCMDDETLYGKEFYRLNFSEAVSLGLLTDYKVIIFGVTADMAKKWMKEYGGESIVAARLGLIKAMEKFKIRKVISYHSSVRSSKQFSGELKSNELSYPDLFATMKEHGLVTGKCWSKSLDAKTPVDARKREMQTLEQFDKKCRAVISNCKVLAEGVDAPAVDAVAFMDPKNSVVEIVQAIGRCMRLCEHKETSYVIVPVFVSEEEGKDDHGDYSQIINVIRALRDHDERLSADIEIWKKSQNPIETPIDPPVETKNLFPQIQIEGGPENWARKLEPRIFEGIDWGKEWTNEEIKREVEQFFLLHKKRPSTLSSIAFSRINNFLWCKKNSSLSKWLDENGHMKDTNKSKYTIDEILIAIDDYTKSNEKLPTNECNEQFKKINRWLRRNHNKSLSQFLEEKSLKPKRQSQGHEYSDAEIKRIVDDFIHTHKCVPSTKVSRQFTSINHWLYRYKKQTLVKWLKLNGYSNRRTYKGFTFSEIQSAVDSHIKKQFRLPTHRSNTTFRSINYFLKKQNSSLCKWLIANGYKSKKNSSEPLKETTNVTPKQTPQRTPRPFGIIKPSNLSIRTRGDRKANKIRKP